MELIRKPKEELTVPSATDTKRPMTQAHITTLAFMQNAFSITNAVANNLMHNDPQAYAALEKEKVTDPYMQENNLKWELDARNTNSVTTIDLNEDDYQVVTEEQRQLPKPILGLGGKK